MLFKKIPHVRGDSLSLYFWFYEVTMLESKR
jgi:hypothetical protein